MNVADMGSENYLKVLDAVPSVKLSSSLTIMRELVSSESL